MCVLHVRPLAFISTLMTLPIKNLTTGVFQYVLQHIVHEQLPMTISGNYTPLIASWGVVCLLM